MEPTEIYAKVYSDGTTLFSSYDYVDSSHGSVGLENLITSNVTDISFTFSEVYDIVELDLSSFDINENTDITGIFDGCTKLKTVYVKNEEIGNLLKNATSLPISFVVK